MKKAIWTIFVILTLIWTAIAFCAAGLARWTSHAIASDRFAETTQYVALTTEKMTQKLTDATGRVAEQVTTAVTQAVGGEAAGENQSPDNGSTGEAAPAASAPTLPPLPEWVNQWLPPETVQSIKEWGAWAKSAANAGKAAVADAAKASARAAPEASKETQAPTVEVEAAVEASQAVEAAALPPAETHHKTVAADAPWLADIVGWLVPIVWVIWGIGLILGLLLALLAQWGASRWIGNPPLKPTSPH